MASAFPSENNTKCEGCHEEGKGHVTYRMEVKQSLCDDCANHNKRVIQDREPALWFCQKHTTDIATIFCITHDSPVCNACSRITHRKPCVLEAIEDVVAKRREELISLIEKGKEREQHIKRYNNKVVKMIEEIRDHFANMEGSLKEAYLVEVRKSIDRFRFLLRQLKLAFRAIMNHSETLKSRSQEIYLKLVENISKAEQLLTDDKMLTENFNDLTKVTDNGFGANINMDSIDNVLGVAQMVKFVREKGHMLGNIDLPVEKWGMEKKLRSTRGAFSCMVGLSSNTEVVILNKHDNSIHIKNIIGGRERKVLDGVNSHGIWKCTFLNDGRVVCGSCDGEVILFDSKWKHIRTINVVLMPGARISVSVDNDGMVLACAIGQSAIYVINPDDGALMRTITVNDRSIFEVHTMSSGNIAIRMRCARGPDVCVIDASGAVTSTVHLHPKNVTGIAVCPSHNALYVTYQVRPLKFAIEVMSFGKEGEPRKIIDCDQTTPFIPTFVLPGSRKLLMYCEGKLHVYKKTSKGLHELLGESDQM